MKVVSLVPSSTETLLAIGANVVACTKFCEQPTILHVGGTKNPDIDAIVELDPDLVVMDREENRRDDADALRRAGLDLLVSDVTTVSEALELVDELASLVDLETPFMKEPVGEPNRSGRMVFVPIWRRPWMSIGAATYAGSLLDHLGLSLVSFGAEEAYPTFDLVDLRSQHPELVVVPSEPYEFTDAHLDEIQEAVPGATVIRVDGRDLFWWGVRTPAAIERLAAQLLH